MDFWRSWPYPVAVLVLFLVALLRAGGTYALGRAAQNGARRTKVAELMARPGFGRVQLLITHWGAPIVTVSFLTVGIQTLVNLAAGIAQMPLRRYLPALGVGALLWGFLYATLGLGTFTALRQLYTVSPPVAIVIIVALLTGIAGYVMWQVRQRRAERVEPSPR